MSAIGESCARDARGNLPMQGCNLSRKAARKKKNGVEVYVQHKNMGCVHPQMHNCLTKKVEKCPIDVPFLE